MPQDGALSIVSSAPLDDDLKIVKSHVDAGKDVPHSVISRLLEWLPAAGGAIGGLVGSVPGAMVGGAAGEGLKQIAKHGAELPGAVTDVARNLVAHPKETIRGGLQGMGQGVRDAASQAAIQGGSELAGGVIGQGMARAGGALMQSAIKPGLKSTARALAKGVATEDLPIVTTLLKEKVNVTPGGIAKLDKIIGATNREIRDAIESLPGSVSPERVAKRTEGLASDLAKQVDPAGDVSAVQGVTNRFLEQPGTTRAAQVGTKQVDTGVLDSSGQMVTREAPVMGRVSRPLSLVEAQDMKTGTYKALKDKVYGEMKGPEIEANKALARGLKEEIENEVAKTTAGARGLAGLPGGINIGALNAREGAAIVTKEAIAKRIAAAGNRDPVALAWLASNPVSAVLFIMERSPVVKSMLARGLYNEAARAANVPAHVLRGLLTNIAESEDEQ